MSLTIQHKIAIIAFFTCLLVIMLQVQTRVELTSQIHDVLKAKYKNTMKHFIGFANIKGNAASCGNLPKLTNLEDFFSHGRRNGKSSCSNLAEIGGHSRKFKDIFPYNEGSRIVCLDGIKRDNCTVLSFGISYDDSFDSNMEMVSACKVHMFDPTINVKDFTEPPYREFHNLGVSDKKGTITIGTTSFKVDRYEGILQMLNLTTVPIDYLKLDVDGSELDFFKDIFSTSLHLLKNVKQIGMEIHPILLKKSHKNMSYVEAFQPYWNVMNRLECLGYDLISFVPNLIFVCKFIHKSTIVSGCYDLVYMKQTVD